MPTVLPVLLYHRIDESGLSTATSPSVFRRQMQWLSEHGWRTLTLDEFTFYLARRRTLPAKSMLITFDDGYDSLNEAAVILADFNYTATCFVITGFLGSPSGETGQPSRENNGFLRWEDARTLYATGRVEFQSHTHEHIKLWDKPLSEVSMQLDASLATLSSEMHLPRTEFTHLAWPWGEFTPEWQQAASALGLRHQYAVGREAFRPCDSMIAIPRTCYDGSSQRGFQLQFQAQTGMLNALWHTAYPALREVRGWSRRWRAQQELASASIYHGAYQSSERFP